MDLGVRTQGQKSAEDILWSEAILGYPWLQGSCDSELQRSWSSVTLQWHLQDWDHLTQYKVECLSVNHSTFQLGWYSESQVICGFGAAIPEQIHLW